VCPCGCVPGSETCLPLCGWSVAPSPPGGGPAACTHPGRYVGLAAVPATTAATLGGRAMVSADRTAVVVVTTAHADAGPMVAVGAAWIAVTALATSWAADLTIAVVEPLAGFVGVRVALGLLVVLAVAPILPEMAVLAAPQDRRRRGERREVHRAPAPPRSDRLGGRAVGSLAAPSGRQPDAGRPADRPRSGRSLGIAPIWQSFPSRSQNGAIVGCARDPPTGNAEGTQPPPRRRTRSHCSTRKSGYPCSGWILRHLHGITLDGTLGAFNPRVVGSIPTGPTFDHVLTCSFTFPIT
jgi:hypothetical protein